MIKPKRIWTALLLCLLLAVSACSKGRELSADEIRTLFSNKTVRGFHEIKKYRFQSYYDPVGVFRSWQGEKRILRTGKWWVTDNDEICIRWNRTDTDLCRRMITDDNNQYWKVKVSPVIGTHKRVVIFSMFENGNPYEL
ncbi:MAG: hypothetical protein D3910_18390 [Candidatus Electrothrix sp. ATG2]|nr:hypothetical protein [Candidatus Electrothrix sp. ATG2]